MYNQLLEAEQYLLEQYQLAGDRIITVMPAERSLVSSLIAKSKLGLVEGTIAHPEEVEVI